MEKFEVYTAKREGPELQYRLICGQALKNENAEYYQVKIWSLYPQTFYLVPTRKRASADFSLYAKRVETYDGVKFQNPIGTGHFMTDPRGYVEIRVRYPYGKLYMSVFPLNSQFVQLVVADDTESEKEDEPQNLKEVG